MDNSDTVINNIAAKYISHIAEVSKIRKPLLVIRCITYNHEKYIRDALEGFVMQKTDFPFVAIVHDDASTDSTATIIREYAEKYPDIILPIFETENQYSKRDGSITKIMTAASVATDAKYVAMCEGDDYWIDPLKLQKQVDFLESHPDYGICYTNFNIFYNYSGKYIKNAANSLPRLYPMIYKSTEDFIEHKGYVCPPSWVYRRSILDSYKRPTYCCDGTFHLFTYFLTKSKAYYLTDITCVYRVLPHSASHSDNWKINYKRHKDLLELQLKIIDQFKLSTGLKERCIIDYYRSNLIFFSENHLTNDLKLAKTKLSPLTSKEKLLILLGEAKIGSYFLKKIHVFWNFIKGI